MSFFDDSHVTDIGLRGSAGPSVGFGEMISQSFQQQFRVDSARALDDELRNRWLESLRAAQITNQVTGVPDPLGRNPSVDPDDPWTYRAFAQHVSGQPIDAFDPNRPLFGDHAYDPTGRIKGMIDANEKIKALNNPNIKTFEQILEEVSQMQQGVEEKTASMSERSGTGGFAASLIGSIGGSFTPRDPLNIITAPIGAGRTVAMRVATDMGLAAAVVGYTELAEVGPARKIAGLSERNPLYNIAAATIGAGVIRGGLEGLGYGVRRLRSENIDFDLRDSQLAQMFEANIEKLSARAGLKLLDDTRFIEHNNPYGEGRAAQERFMAELQEVQRVMGGEPMTAVARVLPPIPYEQLKKIGDFEIVREQAPEVYARMEGAQVRVQELETQINQEVDKVTPAEVIYRKLEDDPDYKPTLEETEILNADVRRQQNEFESDVVKHDLRDAVEEASDEAYDVTSLRSQRRIANAEYETAYREVEAEASRINERQAAVEAAQRSESISILMPTAEGRPFIGPMLQHSYIETLVDRINKFNDALDEQTAARFVRETHGEGEDAVEVEVWERDGGIDIGLKDPVDPNFRFETDEGEMTVAAAMRDLQDDTDLDEAMRTCLT